MKFISIALLVFGLIMAAISMCLGFFSLGMAVSNSAHEVSTLSHRDTTTSTMEVRGSLPDQTLEKVESAK
jgi:hypothetical protein